MYKFERLDRLLWVPSSGATEALAAKRPGLVDLTRSGSSSAAADPAVKRRRPGPRDGLDASGLLGAGDPMQQLIGSAGADGRQLAVGRRLQVAGVDVGVGAGPIRRGGRSVGEAEGVRFGREDPLVQGEGCRIVEDD